MRSGPVALIAAASALGRWSSSRPCAPWGSSSRRWGKEKLARLLPAALATSVSTVGRILAYLKRRGVLREPRRQVLSSRRRPPRPYATRKPKDYVPTAPGELVEIATPSASSGQALDVRPLPGVILKQFTARDVISRWDVLAVHQRATASLAAQFLDTLLERMPVPVRALQGDGGGEFCAEFEAACQSRYRDPFSCCPPKSPKLNAHVERAHRTHTESRQVPSSPDIGRSGQVGIRGGGCGLHRG